MGRDHRTMPRGCLGPNITHVESERAHRAKVLRLTREFSRPLVRTQLGNRMWSVPPKNDEDARGARICAKSDMKVPVSDQVCVDGQWYSSRYAPKPRINDRPSRN